MNQHFGNKLQEIRKKNGLSQEAFAEILEVSRQSVSKWESGQVYPEINKIIFISQYFNISLDELLKDAPQTQQRKVISLSKPFKSIPESPVVNYQTNDNNMLNRYTTPVQPVYVAPKKKLNLPALIGSIALGVVAVALVITAVMENYNNNYVPTEVVEAEEPVIPINISNNQMIYHYDDYNILNKIYYYYDKTQEKYIEILLPVEPYLEHSDGNSYGLEFANVYMDIGICVDVVMVNFEKYGYSEDDVQFFKYYSEQLGKYMTVLVPPTYDESEFSYYGYKVVELYIDGELQKIIVKL